MIPHALRTVTLWLVLLAPAMAGEQADVTLLFSPRGGCETTICNLIDNAEMDILVAAYAFSSEPIANALYRAANRGVPVKIFLDRRQPNAHYSMVQELVDHGLDVRVDKKETMMHMKIIIIDNYLLICGSFNYTRSAEDRNAEILTIIRSKQIATTAAKNWWLHWNHSVKPQPKITPGPQNNLRPSKPVYRLPRSKLRRPQKWSY